MRDKVIGVLAKEVATPFSLVSFEDVPISSWIRYFLFHRRHKA